MVRTFFLSCLIALTGTPAASAQSWARKMFPETSHDFGVVAKDSKAVFDFEFVNSFVEDVHVAGVRSSCGCTEAHITKQLLKTWEKGAIRAVLNTKSYVGRRSATLTVIIDKPYYAEVQLSVRGYIRGDVLFTPGSVAFGDLEFGQEAQRQVKVSYAGRSSWDIVDVRSANPDYFEVELGDKQVDMGRVSYTMLVRLKPGIPAGYLHDQLTIVTNDASNRSLDLPVEGRVVSPLEVRPAMLFLGVLKPGEVAQKQLFVVGTKPFKIVGVECPGDCFEFTIPDSANTRHLLPVRFTAGTQPGKFSQTIEIKTDLGASASCVATATIQDEQAEATASSATAVDTH